jgi:hypothetical protein
MTASPPSRTCCLRRPPANFPARNASAMSRSLQPWNNAALQLKGITNPGIGRPLGCGAAGHRSPCSAPPRTGHLETGLPTISAGLCAGPTHVPTSQRDRGHQALIRTHSTARATGSPGYTCRRILHRGLRPVTSVSRHSLSERTSDFLPRHRNRPQLGHCRRTPRSAGLQCSDHVVSFLGAARAAGRR